MRMYYVQNLTPILVLAFKNTQKNRRVEKYFFTKISPIYSRLIPTKLTLEK